MPTPNDSMLRRFGSETCLSACCSCASLMASHLRGFPSAADSAMRSSPVSLVCRLELTNTSTGLSGLCVWIAA